MTFERILGLRPLLPTHELNAIFEEFNYDTVKTTYPTNYYIAEDGTHVIEHALAGFKANEIKVDVDNNKVDIEAKKSQDTYDKESKRKYYKRGISSSVFKVTWEIPARFDTFNIKAQYTDGILKIMMPESQETKDRRYSVKIND